MIDLARLPIIAKAGTQSSHQSTVPIRGLQQQSPAVGTALALIELGNDWLAKNSWEQQTPVLCYRLTLRDPLLLLQTGRVNMFVIEEASFVFRSLHTHE